MVSVVNRNIDIVQKVKIKAAPDLVYAALSEEEELLKWWPTQVEMDLREGGGFKRSFHPYDDSTEKGQFLRIIPSQLIKYNAESSNFPNILREVTLEIKQQGQHTLMVVTEIGWRRGRLWEKLYRNCQEEWKGVLHDLKSFVETGEDPRSKKKVSPHKLERFRNGRLVIRQRYLYKVKPKKVFQALTVPDRLTKWLLKEAETEFKKNGKMKMVWNDGYAQECKILELDLNKKLTLTWPTNGWAGTPFTNTTVRFTLQPTPEEYTLLEIEHSGFGIGENWTKYYGATYSGWTYYLLNLKSVLEYGVDLRDEVSESVLIEPEEKEPQPEDTIPV